MLGNGTLIGASANVVSAGIAEQNGYKITFKYFMKYVQFHCFKVAFIKDCLCRIGLLIMITTVFSVMVYLLVVHIGIRWNVEKCVV